MTKILILGDYFSEEDERKGEAFSGTSGFILRKLLSEAGIESQDVHLTNVLNFYPGSFEKLITDDQRLAADGYPQYNRSPKQFLSAKFQHQLDETAQLIQSLAPTVIVTLGRLPLWFLTGKGSVDKERGAPLLSTHGIKVIPTYHPVDLFKRWSLRPVLLLDLMKAKKQSEFPELRRQSRKIILEPSMREMEQFYTDHILPAPFITCDVETRAGQITEVGIGVSRSLAIVIPFWITTHRSGNYWLTTEAELAAWQWVRKVLATKKVIGQNFKYDMNYFWRVMGLPTLQFAGDTMLLHHAMYPELEKGLGFLGSVYTDEPAWKFMRANAHTLKEQE